MKREPTLEELAAAMGKLRINLGLYVAAVAVVLGDDYAVTLVARHTTDPAMSLLLSLEEVADPVEVKDRINRALTELLSKDDLAEVSEDGFRALNESPPPQEMA